MKRLLSRSVMICLLLAFFVGTLPTAFAANWADVYLQNLVQREVMKGDKDGELFPDRNITRAEFSAMMNRAFGFNKRANKSFSDVEATSWYAADIDIASFQGYMQGDGKGAKPNGNLTREEAVTMICRALKIPFVVGEEFKLKDERDFANWSRGYINAAVERDFVSGYPDGSFRASNSITRGEAAKLLSEVAGEIVSANKGNASGVVNGNVTIASSGVNISDATVTGDIFLTEGVGLGFVNLRNVSVSGDFIISGAGESNVGESSVTLTDCNINDLMVDVDKQKILTLKTDKSTVVENALIKSSTYLEELTTNYEGFNRVTINGPKGTYLNLRGNFGDVRMMSEGSAVNLYKGQVNGITVDETAKDAKIFLEQDTYTSAIYFDTGATVTGKGQIESVLINNDGVVIDQLPENIYIRPGVTAKINGKVMGSLDAEMDALDPDFSYGYPKIDKIQPTNFTAYFMTNKPGKVYYAVFDADLSVTPTKDELMSKNNAPKDSVKSGNLNSMPDKESSVSISGMKPGKNYVLYSLFVDLRGRSSPIKTTLVETVDNIMPTLLSGYPKLTSTDSDSAKITLIPNKNTQYYWMVLPAGSVAPTSEQVYRQNLSGAPVQGTDNGLLNTPTEIATKDGGQGLIEFKPYVFYVVLRDGAGNMSKNPYKLAFTTKDLTAPEFKPDDGTYPKVGAVTATGIPLEYVVNEPCTLYWSAVVNGTKLLNEEPGEDKRWETQTSKEAIKNGSGGFKVGKSNASKADNLVKFSVSGLAAQMPYDIYFVLEDKQGNLSDVTCITAKTKDVIKPTATVSSIQEINGFFNVDSPIAITFSEIVCGLSETNTDVHVPFTELKKEDLKKSIRLMDTSDTKETEVAIAWDQVKVQTVEAKTVLTFPVEAFPSKTTGDLPGLANNNSYRFDLGYLPGYMIRDTSKNEMLANTKLQFQTVPPLTYFSEVQSFDTAQYDAAFLIRPDANRTAQHIYFDIMLLSKHELHFKLYRGTNIDGLVQVGTDDFLLPANTATPLSDFLKKQTAYRDMADEYYAIKVTKVDSIDVNSVGVTAEIDLNMYALIGNGLKILSVRGPEEDFNRKLKEATNKGEVSIVTAPKNPFALRVTLVDKVAPGIIKAATFSEGDRKILMTLQANKGCTVYYYAIPTALAPGEGITDPAILKKQTTDAAQGIKAGTFRIPDNSVAPTQHTIEGLLPPVAGEKKRAYTIYYCLQGKAPTPSQVWQGEGFTVPTTKPSMNDKLLVLPGDKMVTINGSWDDTCTMFYAVYPEGTTEPDEDQIMGKTPSNWIVGGSQNITTTNEFKFSIPIPNINYKYRYDLYVVAQKYIDGTVPYGDYSQKYMVKKFTSLDTEAPRVAKSITAISGTSADGKRYNGRLTVEFTKALYYVDEGTSDTEAITKTLLEQTMTYSGNKDTIKVHTVAPNTGPINNVTFDFTSTVHGTTISFGRPVGDKMGNLSGQLTMTFRCIDAAGLPLVEPYWEAVFSEQSS